VKRFVLEDNMKRFFVSDLHFGHFNIIKYCNRPYTDVFQMNEAIVDIWNKTVKPEDTVYIIGDFSLNAKYVDIYIPKLNGNKILILGNHDIPFKDWKWPYYEYGQRHDRYIKAGFTDVKIGDWLTLERPKKGFLGFLGFTNRYEVQLCHFPFAPVGDKLNDDLRYLKYRPKDEGQILIHGHLHVKYRKNGRMIDVGFDRDLKLWTEEEIIDIIKDKRDVF
jgi:calcineurin-like phosphoesterase family protein